MIEEINSEKRQRQIDEYLSADYKVGDMVQVRGKALLSNTSQDSDAWNNLNVVGIQPDGKLELRRSGYRPNDYHGELNIIDPKKVEVRKDCFKIGVNPFPEKDWMSCVRTTGYGFSHIYFTMGEIIKNNNVANTINGIDADKRDERGGRGRMERKVSQHSFGARGIQEREESCSHHLYIRPILCQCV